MKGKRTGFDFSKHEIKMTKWGQGDNYCLIHHFKIPDTICHNIKFINTQGLLVVTGDYGNWVFCREFHPTVDKDAGVSDGYWIEKLGTHSNQSGKEYDPEATYERLQAGIDGGLADYGYTDERLFDAIQFYTDCQSYTDSEHEYVAFAYGTDKPSFMDSEEIPFAKKTIPQLEYVFDAFDEICRRLREGATWSKESEFINK